MESVASGEDDDELEEGTGKDDNDGQTLVDNVRGQGLVDTWEAIVEEVEVNGLENGLLEGSVKLQCNLGK